ncbi:putative spindle assembly abnormal protein 6 [Cryptosporidium felis]|nr:putative spindle assembly abnormal protein 6 [Cryptosporidium felis]
MEGKGDSRRFESDSGNARGFKSRAGCASSFAEDQVEVIAHIKDVPICIKYSSAPSTNLSTAPSTPNSRGLEHLEAAGGGNTVAGVGGESSSSRQQSLCFGRPAERIVRKRRQYSASCRIHIEMTRPNDFSFLLSFEISDGGDFLYLRSEQRLLVEFQEFPTMLVDLLNKSKNAGMKGLFEARRETVFPGISRFGSGSSGPGGSLAAESEDLNSLRIVLNVSISDSGPEPFFGLNPGGRTSFGSALLGGADSCILHFVELNHYKEIVHLSLPFEMASDLLFRDYVLRHLNSYFELSQRQEESILRYEKEVGSLKRELETLTDKLSRSSFISARNEKEMSERFELEVKKLVERYENDYFQLKVIYEDLRLKEFEHWNQERQQSEKKVSELQQQFRELSALYDGLSESKSSLEKHLKDDRDTIAELKAKLEAVQSSFEVLSNLKNEQERELNDLKLEYSNALESNNNLRTDLERRQKEIADLDVALDDACKEIEKGNQIISSLQTSLGNVDSKYKQQMATFGNLKRSFQQVEIRNKSLEEKLRDFEQSLEDSNSRQEQLLEENERLRKILMQAEKQIEINQSVIASLKKQLSGGNSSFCGGSYMELNSNPSGGFSKGHCSTKASGGGLANLGSLNGVHYTLGGLQPAVASVSASRGVYLGGTGFSRQRKRSEATFESESITKKYSMSVQPRRSYTWSMESANHEPRHTEAFGGRSGRGSAAFSNNQGGSRRGSMHLDFEELPRVGSGGGAIKKSLETIDERSPSIFTPPNNRNQAQGGNQKVTGGKRVLGEDLRGGSSSVLGPAPGEDFGLGQEFGAGAAVGEEEGLFTFDGTGEVLEGPARELTTPRLKTPVKPPRPQNRSSSAAETSS